MGYKVAVIGATGNVGREMSISLPSGVPADEVFVIACAVDGRRGVVRRPLAEMPQPQEFRFPRRRLRLDVGGLRSLQGVEPTDRRTRLVVIDNSSCWRDDPDVPLIVPEVNADAVAGFTKKNIIANPNCSTVQLVVALKPLHDLAKIKRVVVATYQSVSGAGKEAMDELWNQTNGIFVTDPPEAKSSPSRSPSTSFPISTSSWTTAPPRRNGR